MDIVYEALTWIIGTLWICGLALLAAFALYEWQRADRDTMALFLVVGVMLIAWAGGAGVVAGMFEAYVI